MDKLQELIAKGEAIVAESKELEAKECKTDEERDAVAEALKAKEKEFSEIEAKIMAVKKQMAKEALLAAAKEAAKVNAPGTMTAPPAQAKDHDAEQKAKEDAFVRYVFNEQISDAERSLLAPKSTRFDKARGGVVFPARGARGLLGKAYSEACKHGIWAGKALPLTSVQNTQIVPVEDYRAQLLEVSAEEPHIMGRATVVTTPVGTIRWPQLVQTDDNEYGAVVVTEVDEAGQKPEAEPEFTQVEIQTREVSAYTEVSESLLRRSAIDLEALISRLFRSAMLDHFDNRFLNGSGVGQPLGIINTAGIRTVNRTTAGEVHWADLVRLEHALRAYHRAGAVWIVGDDTAEWIKINALDTTGRPLFAASYADPSYKTLMGYPVLTTHRQPALGNTGDVIFVDLREYIVAMEQEIVLKRSEHYRFRHNVIAYAVYALVGGRLVQPRVASVLSGPGS